MTRHRDHAIEPWADPFDWNAPQRAQRQPSHQASVRISVARPGAVPHAWDTIPRLWATRYFRSVVSGAVPRWTWSIQPLDSLGHLSSTGPAPPADAIFGRPIPLRLAAHRPSRLRPLPNLRLHLLVPRRRLDQPPRHSPHRCSLRVWLTSRTVSPYTGLSFNQAGQPLVVYMGLYRSARSSLRASLEI
jgi:hypothetical protein